MKTSVSLVSQENYRGKRKTGINLKSVDKYLNIVQRLTQTTGMVRFKQCDGKLGSFLEKAEGIGQMLCENTGCTL